MLSFTSMTTLLWTVVIPTDTRVYPGPLKECMTVPGGAARFGKIRYINQDSCRREFNIQRYLKRVSGYTGCLGSIEFFVQGLPSNHSDIV